MSDRCNVTTIESVFLSAVRLNREFESSSNIEKLESITIWNPIVGLPNVVLHGHNNRSA